MLMQSTRERLQVLVQNPRFEGSVHIGDSKYNHTSIIRTTVNIHGNGDNVFSLLAELFPEMKVENIRPYNVEGDFGTSGLTANGMIEDAYVDIWARQVEGQKEKAPIAVGTVEENTHLYSNVEGSELANAIL